MKSFALLGLFATAALAQQEQPRVCSTREEHSANGYYFSLYRVFEADTDWQCVYIDSAETSGVAFYNFWEYVNSWPDYAAFGHAGRDIEEARLVSSIEGISSSADWLFAQSWLASSAVGYDIFTSSDAQQGRGSGDYELKIISSWYGHIAVDGESLGSVRVAGSEWELFKSTSDGTTLYEFVSPDVPLEGEHSLDLKAFFDHLVSENEYPADEQYLTTLTFGSWQGLTSGQIDFNWSVEIN